MQINRIETKVNGIEAKVCFRGVENNLRAVNAKFDRVFQTIGADTQVIIEAIKAK